MIKSKYPQYSVKAGRFAYDLETKKVKVSKTKGKLNLYTNEECENHASWVNLETNLEEIDIIVFPFDATFEQVTGQNNTYVMKFQSNQDRYFFYLQEKINSEQFVKKVNERISFNAEDDSQMEVQQPEPEKMEVEAPSKKPEQKKEALKKAISPDFITRLTNNLMKAQKRGEGDITHLSKVITPESINNLLEQLTEEDKFEMVQFLPEEQKEVQHIASNLRSPQFQQAFDVLSDALNSQNAIPLFMEMGLDQKHLKQHYGVHAFLLALQEKAQKKEEQKKE